MSWRHMMYSYVYLDTFPSSGHQRDTGMDKSIMTSMKRLTFAFLDEGQTNPKRNNNNISCGLVPGTTLFKQQPGEECVCRSTRRNLRSNMYGGLFGDLPAAKKSDTQHKRDKAATPPESNVPPTELSEGSSSSIQKKNGPSHSSSFISASSVHPIGDGSNPPAMVPAKPRVLQMVPRSRQILPSHTLRPSSRKPTTKKEDSQLPVSSVTSSVPCSNTAVAVPKDGAILVGNPTILQEEDKRICSTTAAANAEEEYRIQNVTQAAHFDDTFRPMDVDLYDPMVPNDVHAYWDRQAALAQQAHWAQERAALWRDQAALRQQLLESVPPPPGNAVEEEERRMPRGRGRGGVSNLPAWLVAQQEQRPVPQDEL